MNGQGWHQLRPSRGYIIHRDLFNIVDTVVSILFPLKSSGGSDKIFLLFQVHLVLLVQYF